jgi:hypothetical protein
VNAETPRKEEGSPSNKRPAQDKMFPLGFHCAGEPIEEKKA